MNKSFKDFLNIFTEFYTIFIIMELGKKIASNLTRLRELKGLSQENIADELGMTLSGYGKIERHEVGLTIDKLEKIANILQVQLTDILGFDEKFIFNNNGTQQAQSAYSYFYSHLQEKDFYEQQILSLKEENAYLKKIIDNFIMPKQ